MPKTMAKQPLFHVACCNLCRRKHQRMGLACCHTGAIQYQRQPAARVKDRSASTTEPDVTRPKVLVSVDFNRPLLNNACADSIRAFGSFRPNSAKPYSPSLELIGACLIAAVVNHDSIGVA